MKHAFYYHGGNGQFAEAWREGMARHKADVDIVDNMDYTGMVDADVQCVWGDLHCQRLVIRRCWRKGIPLLWYDNGYYDRKRKTGAYDGHYKITWNHSQAIEYYACPPDRWENANITLQPMREDGEWVVVAGISVYDSLWLQQSPAEWAADTIAYAREEYPGKKIRYRPRPYGGVTSAHRKYPFPKGGGTKKCEMVKEDYYAGMALADEVCAPPLEFADALHGACVVVGWQTIAMIEGLFAGVPADPLGKWTAVHALKEVGGDREAWCRWLAYQQWTLDEMRSGEAWAHLEATAPAPVQFAPTRR